MPPSIIEGKKKPGPKATACPWCGSTSCRCCRCSGFAGCKHAPGEPCSKPRYRRRRLCNPCEKSRLQTIKKMKADGLIHKDVGHCCNKNLRDFLRSHSASSTTSSQVHRRMQSILKQQQKIPTIPSSIISQDDHYSSVLEHGIDQYLTLEDEIHMLMRGDADSDSVTSHSSDEINTTTTTTTSHEETSWNTHQKTMKERRDLVYLNIKGNKTPFTVLPLNRDTDSLRYVREYLVNRVLSKSNVSFTFLSKQGVRIHLSQENEILAMSQVVTRKMKLHHIFIVVNRMTSSSSNSLPGRKRYRDEDSDDDDDDDDDENDEEKRLTKRFHQASNNIQSSLALEYIQNRSGSGVSDSDGGSGAFQHDDNNSLLIVATSRNMTHVVRSLLRMGTDVNEKSNTNGDTALHIATRLGYVDTLKVILKESLASPVSLCGSYDVEIRNNAGQTALDVATDQDVRNLLKTFTTESVVSTMKFRMPSQDTTLANARHELCRVAMQNNRRVAPFLFVLGGILIRPQQEHDFTLEQVAQGSFVRVRVFRTSVSRKKKEKKVEMSALKTLADLCSSVSECSSVVTGVGGIRIEGDGLKHMIQHVARAATSPEDEEDKDQDKDYKDEDANNN